MTNHRMTKPSSALVIGGGIGGIASGIALLKAGIRPTVVEAYERSDQGVGAFLTVAVNGQRALRAIDVDPASLGGFATPRMAMALGDGRELAELSMGAPGTSDVARTIRRSDLYASLRTEAEQRGVDVVYGKRFVSAERTASGVRATFHDGSTLEADLLIGADGLHSKVRQAIDPRAPAPRYVGLLNTGGYARGIDVPGEVGTMRMFFGKRCFFAYLPSPSGEVWWFANPASATPPTREELAARTGEAWRAELLDLFAEDATPARAIVEVSEILPCWATYDCPRVPIWHRDRMIVIGDAAHATSPSSGQGASMALEDAVILAQCLRDGASIEHAFATFEGLRRVRVEKVVAQGKMGGDGKTPGPVGRVMRDLVLRMVLRRGDDARPDPFAWLYQHPIEWDRAVA